MLEPEDYYMEDGKFVLTGKYLLKRGFCCKNGCRHCPYISKTNTLNKREKNYGSKSTGNEKNQPSCPYERDGRKD